MMSAGDPRRDAITEKAGGEARLGIVHAKSGDQPDDTGRPPRKGWPRLLDYFHVAAPTAWNDDLIHYLQDGLPSWCGIFALWSIKKAGFPVGTWVKGSGIASVDGFVNTAKPMKGDIGYIDGPKDNPRRHHCIITQVESNGTIRSVDGNSGIDGEVTFMARSQDSFDAFYTISDDIAGRSDAPDDNPADSDPPAPPSLPSVPAFPSLPGSPGNAGGTYVVRSGDSLSSIARRVYGDPNMWVKIYQANRTTIGPDPGRIYPGQTLVIP
jgi:hypothetical protein